MGYGEQMAEVHNAAALAAQLAGDLSRWHIDYAVGGQSRWVLGDRRSKGRVVDLERHATKAPAGSAKPMGDLAVAEMPGEMA